MVHCNAVQRDLFRPRNGVAACAQWCWWDYRVAHSAKTTQPYCSFHRCVWGWLGLCRMVQWARNHNPSGGLYRVEEES